jgi:hypothetical protein
MTLLRAAAAFVMASLAAGAAAAQPPTTAMIAGTISNTAGAVLPGVEITIWNETIAVERRVTTGDRGDYEIGELAVQGVYVVRAELNGFGTVAQRGVVLQPGQRVVVNMALHPATTETLVVTGRVPTVEAERSAVQQVVGETLVHSLPLVDRDFLSLASLTAGFSGNPNYPSPQGQIYWANNVLVDGASHFSKWRGAARTFNSGYALDSIKEVQVLTSQFSAEFGESLATVTAASTNSGTNDVHGAAQIFVQSGAMNNRPAFTTEKPPFNSQRYSFTLGGPIVKDLTHYFATYEGRRTREENPITSPAAAGQFGRSDQNEHLAFFKIDHKNSTSDLMTMRYNGQWFRWHDEPGGLVLPGNGTQYNNDTHTALVSHTMLLSGATLNQIRVQFSRFTDERFDLNPSVYIERIGYSIEGGSLGPHGFGATPENTIEVADTVSHKRGMHALKFGGGIKSARAHNESLPYGFGAWYFLGASPLPQQFRQSLPLSDSATVVEPHSFSSFAFLQDDWRVHSRLSLNLGVRYDIERISNVNHFDAGTDANNVQPRLGVAWEPVDGSLVVRGGFGLYTQQHLFNAINKVQLEAADGAANITLTRDPNTGQLAPTIPVPGFTPPTFPNALPPTVPNLPPRDIQVADPSFRNPYSIQATIGVERSLHGVLLGADYIYLRGFDLMSIVDTNAPESYVKGPQRRTVAEADATRPTTPTVNGFREIVALGNAGESWYRGLQVKASHTSGLLQTLVSYTYAKAEDLANYLLPEDSRNLPAEKARTDNDIRHNLVVGFTWALPGGPAALTGWTLSGAAQLRTNRPFNVFYGDDSSGTTQNDARPGARNTGETGAYRTVDFGLVRQFHVGTRIFEARAEVFNVINNVNYEEYVGSLRSGYLDASGHFQSFFNQPVTAFPQRRIQLAAVLRF